MRYVPHRSWVKSYRAFFFLGATADVCLSHKAFAVPLKMLAVPHKTLSVPHKTLAVPYKTLAVVRRCLMSHAGISSDVHTCLYLSPVT